MAQIVVEFVETEQETAVFTCESSKADAEALFDYLKEGEKFGEYTIKNVKLYTFADEL